MSRFCTIACLALLTAAVGCAPTLPPSFSSTAMPGLKGPVLALAVEGEEVAAATLQGLFRRRAGGPWEPVAIPGLEDARKVTALALQGGDLFVGTDGEGLHVLSGGEWEVRTARYGGLPDDRILCIAVDGEGDGLPGTLLWVGTRKGIALRQNGAWENFSPEGRWLQDLVGAATPAEGAVYVTTGYRLAGAERPSFPSAVGAIGVGPDRVVAASGNRLAILAQGSFAVVTLEEIQEVTALLVERTAVWCGTSEGLFWGGLLGVDDRAPYPTWRPRLAATGTVFQSRDTRPFHYHWHLFGFNTARVAGLDRDGRSALWVAYRADSPEVVAVPDSESLRPHEGVRRYGSVDEYLVSGDKPFYETYGKAQGLRGHPTALRFGGGVWVGTTSELVNLR